MLIKNHNIISTGITSLEDYSAGPEIQEQIPEWSNRYG